MICDSLTNWVFLLICVVPCSVPECWYCWCWWWWGWDCQWWPADWWRGEESGDRSPASPSTASSCPAGHRDRPAQKDWAPPSHWSAVARWEQPAGPCLVSIRLSDTVTLTSSLSTLLSLIKSARNVSTNQRQIDPREVSRFSQTIFIWSSLVDAGQLQMTKGARHSSTWLGLFQLRHGKKLKKQSCAIF